MILLNGEIVKPTLFPDGTSQVWKLDCELTPMGGIKGAEIVWYFEFEHEFIHLMQLAGYCTMIDNVLKIPYLPYARQDKPFAMDATWALEWFADTLNNYHFDEVQLFDPHSDVATQLIKNAATFQPNLEEITEGYDVVIFPDKGARDRYETLIDKPVGHGEKVREQGTGWITGYNFECDEDLDFRKVLVVDDICDGGATFNILGEHVPETTDLDLYVSHGIFSKGYDELLKRYGKIITTDSFIRNRDAYDRKKVIDAGKLVVLRNPLCSSTPCC